MGPHPREAEISSKAATSIALRVAARTHSRQERRVHFQPEVSMLKFTLLIALLVSFSAQSAFAAVGFREMTLPDKQGRHMHVSIWYPTDTDRLPVLLGETPAFRGQPVVKDAEAVTGPHPLVLLSHGYGGSWRNLAWLASELVRKGYVVAAPDHPGTTSFDMRPPEAVFLWEAPARSQPRYRRVAFPSGADRRHCERPHRCHRSFARRMDGHRTCRRSLRCQRCNEELRDTVRLSLLQDIQGVGRRAGTRPPL